MTVVFIPLRSRGEPKNSTVPEFAMAGAIVDVRYEKVRGD
jgi:hypothetical protein